MLLSGNGIKTESVYMTDGRGFYYPRPFLSVMVCRACGVLFEFFLFLPGITKGYGNG